MAAVLLKSSSQLQVIFTGPECSCTKSGSFMDPADRECACMCLLTYSIVAVWSDNIKTKGEQHVSMSDVQTLTLLSKSGWSPKSSGSSPEGRTERLVEHLVLLYTLHKSASDTHTQLRENYKSMQMHFEYTEMKQKMKWQHDFCSLWSPAPETSWPTLTVTQPLKWQVWRS